MSMSESCGTHRESNIETEGCGSGHTVRWRITSKAGNFMAQNLTSEG